MFLRHNDHPIYADLSMEVRDPSDWKIGTLKEFEFPLDITALAFDPISHLLALGTSGGAVYLHGGPGVESKLLLPEPIPVRFLHFGLQTERLVCSDETNQLHVWDLSPLGCPKYMATVRWDPITFMAVSPSHNHIFLAMGNGELKTYDLACMRKSPYTVPNMWQLYQEQMLKSGIPRMDSGTSRHQPVELVAHPRDLNLLFVAYEDGVALLDLKGRSTVHVFELILPPGAPGGTGYASENQDILTHRRSLVTSIAVHPSAHFFAIGHTDGSISFWAVEESDKPILVRTLDDFDVNVVNAVALEDHLGNSGIKSTDNFPPREPIFKLAWSGFLNSTDPRGGETVLTILGGLRTGNMFGLTVLRLPPFNPGEPPATSPPAAQSSIHPFMAIAMRQSLTEQGSFFYSTNEPVQDFYLTPSHSPHFNNSFDPYAILMLVGVGQDARMIEPREFPPPCFSMPRQQPGPQETEIASSHALNELDITFQSLTLNSYPQYVGLPFASFCGSNIVADGFKIHVVPNDIYLELVKDLGSQGEKPRIHLKRGASYVEPSPETRLVKHQPHRVLITTNRNLIVSFYDISGQLLQGTIDTPLEHWFPEPIDSLEIDLGSVLDDIDVGRHSTIPQRFIQAAHFAAETLECAVALNTGELIIYHPRSDHTAQGLGGLSDKEFRSLKHVIVEPWRRLLPYFTFHAPERGSIQTFAVSEIGFLAISFTDGSLIIVDMRGPTIIHRGSNSSDKQRQRYSLTSHLGNYNSAVDDIASLTWTVSGMDQDSDARIRLIAIRTSGDMEIYTVVRSDAGFALEGAAVLGKGVPNPFSDGTFVITSKAGTFCKADRRRFATTLQSTDRVSEPVVLVTAGVKGVRSFANLNGERIGKADWSSKHGDVARVQIVEKLGSKSFVAYTKKGFLHAYSLPHLEHIFTISALPSPPRFISIDESGDFMTFDVHPTSGLIHSATYGTVFDFRRAHAPPIIDLTINKGVVPTQPQPVSMGPSSLLGSWFNFNQTMSGGQIDGLLGGPDKPVPVKRARDSVPKQPEDRGARSAGTATLPVDSASATQSNLYNRLTAALTERGQMLGDLEENFKVLEQGSRDMAAQAKRLAVQNSAKSWFGL